MTLAAAGIGVFGSAVIGNSETLTINASSSGGADISFAAGSQITGTGKVVFNGSLGNDTFTGTDAADTMSGGTGNDVLSGGAGDDIIRTGSGSNVNTDNVDGGTGDDEIHIESGTKLGTISGGADNDHTVKIFSIQQPWAYLICSSTKVLLNAKACSFRKFHPAQICVVRQNHYIIRIDVCDLARARNVRRRHVQVATKARSREPVSSSSAQHRLEAGAASSAVAR